jgi:DNA-binding beta-propeller fold protein YncE
MLSIRRLTLTTAAAIGALAGCLAFAGAPALAAPAPFFSQGSLGAEGPDQVAVESSSGDLLVSDPGANRVIKVSPAGAVLGEITGAETPQMQFGLSSFHGVAVDNSSSSSKGDVYIATSAGGAANEPLPVVDKFAPKAGKENEYEYVCELVGVGGGCHKEAEKEGFPPTTAFGGFGAPIGVAVGPTGEVYVEDFQSFEAKVYEFGPEGEDVAGSPLGVELNNYGNGEGYIPVGIAVDGAGDIYLAGANTSIEAEQVVEINAEGDISLLVEAGASAVAVDPTSGELFVLDSAAGDVIRYDSTGGEIERFGEGELGEAKRIAYSAKSGAVYVTDEANDEIHVFAPASAGSPEVSCSGSSPTALGPTSVTLLCTVDPEGEETHWHFSYRKAKSSESSTIIPSPEGAITATGPVEVTIDGLQAQTEYEYRLTARNDHGGKASPTEVFATKPAVEGIEPCAASSVEGQSATLGGSTLETVGGVEAKWRFEYGLGAGYGLETAERTVTSFPALAQAPVTGLEPNAEYHCRLVASDQYGTTTGDDGTFKTKALPPLAGGEPASLLAAHAATLVARVNPMNSATSFHFEFGPTAAYGQQTPDEAVGSGLEESYVRQRIEGLAVRSSYHFRVVARNEQDMIVDGPDETFTTGAEAIPGVQTGTASDVSQTGASISGTVDPEGLQTSYAFEVGTDTNYSGARLYGSAGQGEGPEPITVALQDLAPATTYHFRLIASNVDGTSDGQDMTFTTPSVTSPLLQPLSLPLLATASIVLPAQTEGTTTTTTTTLTRAQKLARALKQCRKDRSKSKRTKCEKQARKRYGTKKR